jgi:hypothetical protein
MEKTSIGSPRLTHCSNGSVCLVASRKAVNREASASRGKRLADCQANTLNGTCQINSAKCGFVLLRALTKSLEFA